MSKYPAQIDTTATLPLVVDSPAPITADAVNRLRNVIVAIEKELGVKPSSVYGTVKARLDALENSIAPSSYVKSVMAEISVDTSIAAAYPAFETLVTTNNIVFGGSGASFALIRFTGATYHPTSGAVNYRLVVDGAPVRGMLVKWQAVASISAIQYRMSLAAGPHTFAIEVRDPVNCNPVTQPNDHHAVLIVEEILA